MRARTKVCLRCGEAFSPQGLSGHLRFVHASNSGSRPSPPVERQSGAGWILALLAACALAVLAAAHGRPAGSPS